MCCTQKDPPSTQQLSLSVCSQHPICSLQMYCPLPNSCSHGPAVCLLTCSPVYLHLLFQALTPLPSPVNLFYIRSLAWCNFSRCTLAGAHKDDMSHHIIFYNISTVTQRNVSIQVTPLAYPQGPSNCLPHHLLPPGAPGV